LSGYIKLANSKLTPHTFEKSWFENKRCREKTIGATKTKLYRARITVNRLINSKIPMNMNFLSFSLFLPKYTE
jgi:hypothetical protein